MVLTMLAAVAELERENIKARQMAGIEKAKADGRRLGAPKQHDDAAIAAWRKETGSSIATTADHWGVSLATVKRACRASRTAPDHMPSPIMARPGAMEPPASKQ